MAKFPVAVDILLLLIIIIIVNLSAILTQKIEIKSLTDNPGILPLRLGPARIQMTHHTFIHNYALTPFSEHVIKIENLLNNLSTRFKEQNAVQNLRTELGSVIFEKDHLKASLQLIHPDILTLQNNRTKRGLFNAIGSVFKFISGTLDSDDAIRYDSALNELKTNQENLLSHYNQQLSVNHKLIQDYQGLFENISHNFKVLNTVVQTTRDQEFFGILTMLKINVAQLQGLVSGIQTAVSFASLNLLHLSIINEDQISQMKASLKRFHAEEFYYSADNILFLKTINVDFYITPDHIVFLLHVPILDPKTYNLYHLYSIPTVRNTTIIPPTSYVAMCDNSIYYLKRNCKYIQQQYFCSSSDVQRNFQQDTCIKNLLQVKKNPECRHVPINVTDSLVEIINSEKYLLILPERIRLHEKCGNEEVHNLKGIFLINVPYSCSFITKDFTYTNLENTLKEEPVYLPPLNEEIADVKPIHLNLKSINLDQLNKLTLEANSPPLAYIHSNTHTWTHSSLPIYFILIIIITSICYLKRKQIFKFCQPKIKQESVEELAQAEAFPTHR